MTNAVSPGRPGATTRRAVLDAGRRMVESGGAASVSMRKLAAELGVAPPSIYRHAGSREQVLNQLVDELLAELGDIHASGATPAERVASIARTIRRQVRDHPELVSLAHELGRGPATSFPGQVALAREVTAAGLSGADAARAVRSVLFLVGGFILLEGLPPPPPGTPPTQSAWRKVNDDAIEPGLLAEMRKAPDTDDLFEFSLSRLLRSLL
ncbi:MAG: transcriptional regulator, TetR family [Acidimicrobiales bacterium]|nr:transcriptional regulator, TetR family [Acidimicrobiales bacterium]